MDEKLAELREAYVMGRAPYEQGLSYSTYHDVVVPADALIAALEQRAAELEAALNGLLATMRANCLDVLQEEAQHYTRMGYPKLDVRAQAVYAEVMAAVEAAAEALAAKRNGV